MESLPNSVTALFVPGPNGVVTEDGLVLKNVDKIENIRCDRDSRISPGFRSWQVCRNVRRDFNLLCVKMFCRGKDKAVLVQCQGLLLELRIKAEELREAVSHFDPDPNVVELVVPLRIVSPTAHSLIRALLIADEAFARLNLAVKSGKIVIAQLHEYSADFDLAYSDIKFYLTQSHQHEKTAEQLGAEHRIA